MVITDIKLDASSKEKIIFQNRFLHYSMYAVEFDNYFRRDIPWHWHDEFEFGYIAKGTVRYRTIKDAVVFREGDALFINAGTLHCLEPLAPVEDVKLRTQFFDTSFLAGSAGNLFDFKYIVPVQESRALGMVPFFGRDAKNEDFIGRLKEGIDLSLREEPFFELRLRSLFSSLWEIIYRLSLPRERQLPVSAQAESPDEKRLKKIMLYIEEHYMDRLTVADLAAVIPVSARECYRLFRKNLDISPMDFVISFRLQKAQSLLIYSDKSILEIAVETGFGTSSYFGKLFRQHHHISPGEFRRLRRQKQDASSTT